MGGGGGAAPGTRPPSCAGLVGPRVDATEGTIRSLLMSQEDARAVLGSEGQACCAQGIASKCIASGNGQFFKRARKEKCIRDRGKNSQTGPAAAKQWVCQGETAADADRTRAWPFLPDPAGTPESWLRLGQVCKVPGARRSDGCTSAQRKTGTDKSGLLRSAATARRSAARRGAAQRGA
eukprot:gene9775-biopygen19754